MRASRVHLAWALLGLLGLGSAIVPAAAQQVRRPFRNARSAERLAMARSAIDSLTNESRAIRRALVDSALGTAMWLEFSAEQQSAERRAGTVEGVVSQFLASYRRVLGTDDPGIELRQVEREVDGSMVHLRFRQFWRGLPVKGGELRLHLRHTARGYALETANGRLYPDIEAPETPALDPSAAAAMAAWRVGDELRVDSTPDGLLSIMPYASGYRLAYGATGRRLRATVDARSGEILDTVSTFRFAGRVGKNKETGVPRSISRAPISARSNVGRLLVPYEYGSGYDAFGVRHLNEFVVFSNGTDYELRSTQLGMSVSEVIVREYDGASIEYSCLGPPLYPAVARNPSLAWPPNDPARGQQVSAMINGLSTGAFYHDSLGRRSYDDANPGGALNMCVNGTLHYGYAEVFNASANMMINTLQFVRTNPSQYLGSASTKDVVTHEFTHLVTHAEDVAEDYGTLEVAAVNEALSDYFGARHRRNPTIAIDAYPGGLRSLTTFRTYGDSLYGQYNWSLAFSGPLWQVASLSNPLGKDVDNAVYNAIRFYMLESAQMLHSREAVVRAAQDRKHANQNLADIVPSLEDAFADRGIGYPPVFVWQSTVPNCGMGVQVTVGDTNRRYQITFESGSGLNQDHSVTNVSYSAQLAPFGWHDGDQTFQYTPEQLGGHQLGDGHAHDLRVRFNDGMLGVAGILLDYYVGWAADEECYAFPNEGSRQRIITEGSVALGGIPPAELTVRQVVSDGAGVRVEMSGGARPDGARPGLAAQVARSGLMTLEYGVPAAARGRTTIRVYDLRGRLVRTMTDVPAGPGWARVTWDGRDDSGSAVAAGVYLAVVRAGEEAVRSRFIVPAR